MCKHGTTVTVNAGPDRFKADACMLPELLVLREIGIKTVGHCCGHGERPGEILIKRSSGALARYIGYETRPASLSDSYHPDDVLIMESVGAENLDPTRLSTASRAWHLFFYDSSMHSIQEALSAVKVAAITE